MPPKFVIVLGVSHRVQGDSKVFDAIVDADYPNLLKSIIRDDRIDFVGEECDDNTTIAEEIVNSVLEAGHYLNVNPSTEERERYYHGSPLGEPPVSHWHISKIEELENFWINKLIERNPTRGLLICGYLHTFSVAAKLLKQKFEVEARTYMPWEKLGSC